MKGTAADGYVHDVFISYKRHQEWGGWVKLHILNLLDTYLSQELARKPDIFIDERIEPGADWPMRLGHSLGRARVLIPIMSRDYFSSDWCLHELDLMHGRLRRYPDTRLIIPLVRHDGEMIPNEIKRIQSYDIKRFSNPDLQRKTPRYEQFSDMFNEIAPSIAEAISSVPEFDEVWPNECINRFNELYLATNGESPKPSLDTFTIKSAVLPNQPPRVRI